MTGLEMSEILNWVLGGSLAAAMVSIVTIRSALRKARAEADRALAEADTVKITNTEQATRILVENIVNPLTEELNETRKELAANRRETARLRKAIDSANSCRYSDDCPVLDRVRESAKDGERARGKRQPKGRDRRDGDSGDCDGGGEGRQRESEGGNCRPDEASGGSLMDEEPGQDTRQSEPEG